METHSAAVSQKRVNEETLKGRLRILAKSILEHQGGGRDEQHVERLARAGAEVLIANRWKEETDGFCRGGYGTRKANELMMAVHEGYGLLGCLHSLADAVTEREWALCHSPTSSNRNLQPKDSRCAAVKAMEQPAMLMVVLASSRVCKPLQETYSPRTSGGKRALGEGPIRLRSPEGPSELARDPWSGIKDSALLPLSEVGLSGTWVPSQKQSNGSLRSALLEDPENVLSTSTWATHSDSARASAMGDVSFSQAGSAPDASFVQPRSTEGNSKEASSSFERSGTETKYFSSSHFSTSKRSSSAWKLAAKERASAPVNRNWPDQPNLPAGGGPFLAGISTQLLDGQPGPPARLRSSRRVHHLKPEAAVKLVAEAAGGFKQQLWRLEYLASSKEPLLSIDGASASSSCSALRRCKHLGILRSRLEAFANAFDKASGPCAHAFADEVKLFLHRQEEALAHFVSNVHARRKAERCAPASLGSPTLLEMEAHLEGLERNATALARACWCLDEDEETTPLWTGGHFKYRNQSFPVGRDLLSHLASAYHQAYGEEAEVLKALLERASEPYLESATLWSMEAKEVGEGPLVRTINGMEPANGAREFSRAIGAENILWSGLQLKMLDGLGMGKALAKEVRQLEQQRQEVSKERVGRAIGIILEDEMVERCREVNRAFERALERSVQAFVNGIRQREEQSRREEERLRDTRQRSLEEARRREELQRRQSIAEKEEKKRRLLEERKREIFDRARMRREELKRKRREEAEQSAARGEAESEARRLIETTLERVRKADVQRRRHEFRRERIASRSPLSRELSRRQSNEEHALLLHKRDASSEPPKSDDEVVADAVLADLVHQAIGEPSQLPLDREGGEYRHPRSPALADYTREGLANFLASSTVGDEGNSSARVSPETTPFALFPDTSGEQQEEEKEEEEGGTGDVSRGVAEQGDAIAVDGENYIVNESPHRNEVRLSTELEGSDSQENFHDVEYAPIDAERAPEGGPEALPRTGVDVRARVIDFLDEEQAPRELPRKGRMVPVDVALEGAVGRRAEACNRIIGKACVAAILHEGQLGRHMRAIYEYVLLERGDFAEGLAESVRREVTKTKGAKDLGKRLEKALHALLDGQPPGNLTIAPAGFWSGGVQRVEIKYGADWPSCDIVHAGRMHVYQAASAYLLMLTQASTSLARCWKELRGRGSVKTLVMRSCLAQALGAVQAASSAKIHNSARRVLESALAGPPAHLSALKNVFAQHAQAVQEGCLLEPRQKRASEAVQELAACALRLSGKVLLGDANQEVEEIADSVQSVTANLLFELETLVEQEDGVAADILARCPLRQMIPFTSRNRHAAS